MSRSTLEAFTKAVWSFVQRPLLPIERAISIQRRSLRLAGSLIRRSIEAKLRDALVVGGLAMAALVLGLAGGVFLLMALWGGLSAYLGPNVASLSLGLALVVAGLAPAAIALRRATPRRRARD